MFNAGESAVVRADVTSMLRSRVTAALISVLSARLRAVV